MSAIFWGTGRASRYATDNVLRTTSPGVVTASAAPSPALRALRIALAILFAVVLVAGTAPAALAAKGGGGKPGGQNTVSYAAVGDSYAAGQGAGSYLNTTCYVSSKGYPAVLDAARTIQLTARPACSGASTAEVISGQVPQIPTTATRVTVTVGGNDMGFSTVMQNCFVIVSSSACDSALGTVDATLAADTMTQRIADVVTAIKARAPGAKVIVTGYPRLFASTVTRAYAQRVNGETTGLNADLRQGALNSGAVFVDVETVFATHGIGSPTPWINDWSWFNTSAGFHPNAAGYAAYATQITPAM